MKRSLAAILIALACAGAHATGDGSHPSQAASELSATVVGGSIASVALSGTVVVASVRAVGDGLELLLENSFNASRATVRLSGKAAGGLSLAAGTVLELVASSAGHVLVLSGKAIAFLPNEIGRALLHSSRVH
ncbi:hypothetical protein [Massilia niastensis]|uniref:hypothetical protein n=1 Tax=Massilia niastensis TaxID=544911 RepID=UPI0003784398|nr:hypothetical protein [Massilia niastensis]